MSMNDGLPRHTRTVRLSELVERVVHSAYGELQALATNLPGQPEADRKRELARYLHNLRQRLVRLAVIAEWAPTQRRAQISILCGDMLGQLRQHELAFTDSADRLFSLHGQMEWAKAPLYDLPGALDVLCNGKYSCLPASIADVAPRQTPAAATAATTAGGVSSVGADGDGGGGSGGGSGGGGSGGDVAGAVDDADARATAEREEEEDRARRRRIEREIRGRLLEVEAGGSAGGSRPAAMRVWEIANGGAVVGVPGEYRAMLTLGGPAPLPPPPPPPAEGEEPAPPPPLPPPPPHGGWFVQRIEMLAGERTTLALGDAAAAAGGGDAVGVGVGGDVVRRFPLTRLEHRVLGERATARMAGMSPPPPAPPELIEGGAQGLAGLHYVCHDAVLRLCAATVMAQSKRLGRGGVAVRTEPIKGGGGGGGTMTTATTAEGGDGSSAQKEKGGGGGEGVRVWFWLPGASVGLGAAGTRLAGVDVGSVEAVKAGAAAIDAAVAAGTLPRVELTYVRADEKDSSSGSIQAAALIPPQDVGGSSGGGDGGGASGGGAVGGWEFKRVPLPFDTAAVDVREVLADGIRAASRERLRRVLAEITSSCQAMGLAAPSLEHAVINPGLAAAAAAAEAAEARAGWGSGGGGGGAGAGAAGVVVRGDGEDGWGSSPRPSIVVRLTGAGTAVEVTCGKRDGTLSLCGVGALLPSAEAASLESAVRGGGAGAFLGALASLRRAAVEHDLRAAVRVLGHHPHPAPHTLRCDRGWPFGGAPPAVLLPVAPNPGGCYVAAFVGIGREEEEHGAGAGAGRGSGNGNGNGDGGGISKASLALLHTRRINAAARAEVLSWAPLTAAGGVLGSKKRKAGEDGVVVEGLSLIAAGMVAAVEAETVTAQRLAVAGWLAKRGVRFQDVRPIRSAAAASGNGGSGAGAAAAAAGTSSPSSSSSLSPPYPAITFSARLGDGEWGAEETAAVEFQLRGKRGVYATIRSSWAPPQSTPAATDAAAAMAAAATAATASAAVASCGGRASITFGGDGGGGGGGGGGCVVALDYPGASVVGGVEFSPGAACADVHRAVASLAFLRAIQPALASSSSSGRGALRVLAAEPLSALLLRSGGAGGGGGGGGGGGDVKAEVKAEAGEGGGGGGGGVAVVRVAWVGAAGPEGGLAAAAVDVNVGSGEEGASPITAAQEDALSEAARTLDVQGFCDAFQRG